MLFQERIETSNNVYTSSGGFDTMDEHYLLNQQCWPATSFKFLRMFQ